MSGGGGPFRPFRRLASFAATALVFGLLLFPATGLATEEFARRTMTFLNPFLVLAVLPVIALWRWW